MIQTLRYLASAVRRTQGDDPTRSLVRMKMKQRADQDTTETVTHEMQRVRTRVVKEIGQPPGVGTQIGAHGGIRKVLYDETLAT